MKTIRTCLLALVAAVVATAGAYTFITPEAVALERVPSTTTFPARVNTTQQTNYHRFKVNYNDAGISAGIRFARLPKDAFLSRVACHVTTAFNASSTNVFTVGTSATANEIIDAATSTKSIDESSATVQQITHQLALGTNPTSADDVDLYAKYTQTGDAATAGSATCVIEYAPNNDK